MCVATSVTMSVGNEITLGTQPRSYYFLPSLPPSPRLSPSESPPSSHHSLVSRFMLPSSCCRGMALGFILYNTGLRPTRSYAFSSTSQSVDLPAGRGGGALVSEAPGGKHCGER